MQQRTFLGHPLGLYILFFTEMWERFCYYGMRALLVLYLTDYWKMAQSQASTIYKIYTTLVYITPILGGYLADRFLGNRLAVVIGAILMATGEFALTVPDLNVFYIGLGFLIFGNGFFKPNMSIQVGRLYPAGDPRRDGAYTIFYMGINLGAFLAPLVCAEFFAKNFEGGRRTGFAVAGIGMLLALAIYLIFQKWIVELPPGTAGASGDGAAPSTELTEAQAERAPSALGSFNESAPGILTGIAVVAAVAGLGAFGWALSKPLPDALEQISRLSNFAMAAIAGGVLVVLSRVGAATVNGVRDRVLAIIALGVFTVAFWAVFEQAGNVQNIWAEYHTNRMVRGEFEPPETVPGIPGETKADSSNFADLFKWRTADKPEEAKSDRWEVTAESFQSINALMIFVFAPIFAWMWVWLAKKNLDPPTPFKMALGLVLISASTFAMIAAAKREDRQTEQAFAGALPTGLAAGERGAVSRPSDGGPPAPVHAGRLTQADGKLFCRGVLPPSVREGIVAATAPAEFVKALEELRGKSAAINRAKQETASVRLPATPPGFDLKYAGLRKSVASFDPATGTLTAGAPLGDREIKSLKVAAGEPGFRSALGQLASKASRACVVSPWWLVLSYLLATFGELCLSPVGLSMVSKLAPARYATMLMGVWLLMSAFGNFVAGALGEMWGTVPPEPFFWITTLIGSVAAGVLFLLARVVCRAMHGVR